MSANPIELNKSLQIGTVDFVSPSEIRVSLDIESPESIALNSGAPQPFPKVNSYVLIPNNDGFLVGQIEWLTIEPSLFPKRRGMKDFGLVDLPFPLRKIKVNPLGSLKLTVEQEGKRKLSFKRGVESYPSIGDPVQIPTEDQLRDIVESGENRFVKIGTSPLAGNAEVRVDPDRMFGRHLAVLGNTGSGKSCSVAGLIRWSLEAAKSKMQDSNKNPNARFIILDPNGEYKHAFEDLHPRVFSVKREAKENLLQVPLWFWNTAEWTSITKASSGAQQPTLIHALRMVRDGQITPNLSLSHGMRRYLRTLISISHVQRNKGNPWGGFPANKNFLELIKTWRNGLSRDDQFTYEENVALEALISYMDSLISEREKSAYPNLNFTANEIDQLIDSLGEVHNIFGGSDVELVPISADIPLRFNGSSLISAIEASSELLEVGSYVETLILRIRTLLSDDCLKEIIGDSDETTLESWLEDYVGKDQGENGCIAVIDLSMVPSEVIHVITAVIARVIFESVQRYRKSNPKHDRLPTILVMEEAHTFIKRYKDDIESKDTAVVCCKVFEKIAREGRKFGLGLVVSSQRPSELSPTVLSQCNTFLLHRITNGYDQDLVNRYVPDNLRGLLGDLPSLPSQHAILLGWATELPILVRMSDLSEEHQPLSKDPDFWAVWTGEKKRIIDWKKIETEWVEGRINTEEKQDQEINGVE